MPKVSSVIKSEHVARTVKQKTVSAESVLVEKEVEPKPIKRNSKRESSVIIAPRDGYVDTSPILSESVADTPKSVEKGISVFQAFVGLMVFIFRPRLVLTVCSVVSLFLLVSYLFDINSYTTSGYEVRKLSKEVTDLKNENKKLQISLSEATAIGTLRQSPETEEYIYVDPTEIKFLND
jgi:hypothetical protein